MHRSARVFRARAEFVGSGPEVRIHVLCECGSGAWLAAIAPFPDLFFDERALTGRTVGEGLAWLKRRYGHIRPLAEVTGPVQPKGPAGRRVKPGNRNEPARQCELALAPGGS